MKVVVLVVLSLSLMTACGSGSSPRVSGSTTITSPTTESTTATTTRATTTTALNLYPDKASDVRVHTDSKVIAEEIAQIRDYVTIAQRTLGDSGPLDVLAYADLDEVVKGYQEVTKQDPVANRIRETYSGTGIAQAGPHWILVWLPSVRAEAGVRPNRLATLVFHEYFHTLANHIVSRDQPNRDARRLSLGWIYEGAAEYYARRTADSHGLESYADLRRRLVTIPEVRATGPLSAFEDPSSGDGRAVTNMRVLALEFLSSQHGDGAKGEYWKNLRQTKDGRQAFSATFGVTLDEFYAAFESFRRSQ